MKIIKRTLILLAMFTMLVGNTFADELKLACKYRGEGYAGGDKVVPIDEEFIATIFLDTKQMTASIQHSNFPIKKAGKWTVEDAENALKKVDGRSAKLHTDGTWYGFALFGTFWNSKAWEIDYKYQYQINRNDLSLMGLLRHDIVPYLSIIGDKCTIVKNTTLI